MSITSTLEMNIKVQSQDRSLDLGVRQMNDTRLGVRSITENTMRSSSPSSPNNSKLRLGEAVRHSGFGAGQVLAHWPDGTLLVRFDNLAKNRLVWPSFLSRANGQGR